MSLQDDDKKAAAVAVAPRVTLMDIENAMGAVYHFNAHEAVMLLKCPAVHDLRTLSICLVVMRNGFMIVGKSAPTSPANFNQELEQRLAYEDCVRQIWPLMGFALRDRLSAAGS